MEVDLGKAIPVTTLERLAAWGARYARICCFMSPLVKTLNKARMGDGDSSIQSAVVGYGLASCSVGEAFVAVQKRF